MRHVTDARGTAVELPDRVGRVVSLVPSLTEWLVVTGVGERLVGVTARCVEPAGRARGAGPGPGTKNPDLAAVRRPGVTWSWPTPRRTGSWTSSAWRRAGFGVFVTMPTTVAGAVGELRDLAAAVGDLPGAAALDADLVAAVADAYRRQPVRRVRYACSVWRDRGCGWAAGPTRPPARAGRGEPVLDDPATRYPKLDLEELAAREPEVVLLPSKRVRPGRRRRGGRRLRRGPGRAGRRPRTLWYSPRIPAALAGFRELLAGGP